MKGLILLGIGTLEWCVKSGILPHETGAQTPIPTLASISKLLFINNLRLGKGSSFTGIFT